MTVAVCQKLPVALVRGHDNGCLGWSFNDVFVEAGVRLVFDLESKMDYGRYGS